MSETPQTITLSDGSVWKYDPSPAGASFRRQPWVRQRTAHGKRCNTSYPFIASPNLTADDHRKIADVLQPPADPPRESEDTRDAARWRAFRDAEGTSLCSVGPTNGFYLSGHIWDAPNNCEPSYDEYADALVRMQK